MTGRRDAGAHRSHGRTVPQDSQVFDRNVEGLGDAKPTADAELTHGGTYDFRAAPVRKRIGNATVKMLAVYVHALGGGE